MVIAILITFAGCQGNSGGNAGASGTADQSSTGQTAGSTGNTEPVKISYPNYRVGTHVNAAYEAKILENFKKKYAGQIELNIEELPSDKAYEDKIKVLLASGDPPDVVAAMPALQQLALKGNLFVDLKPYLDADPEWKDAIGEDAIKANTFDGKVVSASEGRSVAGYYYNKEMFEKAGIKPAATWDEWFTNLDALKKTGVIPVALMTGENSWTTNLILASIIGTSGEAGNTFMNTPNCTNYETPEFIDALTKVQKMLQEYTSKDALGATYNVAANNFLSGKAAIIANGIWMTSDFVNTEKTSPDFDKKVGIAVYPGSGLFSIYDQGFMVLSKDKEHADAAAKLVKAHDELDAQKLFLDLCSNFPLNPSVQPSEEFKANNPLFTDLNSALANTTYKYRFMNGIDYPNVEDAFSQLYPALAMGKLTPADMAKKLTETAKKNVQ